MLETFTVETFRTHAQSKFTIEVADQAMELELADVNELGKEPIPLPPQESDKRAVERIPFSLIFHGPAQPCLPQRIYPFTHEKMGSFSMFIVPIGPNPDGNMQYEAVFN